MAGREKWGLKGEHGAEGACRVRGACANGGRPGLPAPCARCTAKLPSVVQGGVPHLPPVGKENWVKHNSACRRR